MVTPTVTQTVIPIVIPTITPMETLILALHTTAMAAEQEKAAAE